MADSNALWHATFRKETMDLLAKLWTTLDDQGRDALAAVLLAGPPADLLAKIEEDEREKSRDRRIFDRIVVLERLQEPPLTPALAERMAMLRERYPEWRSAPGEQAHFGSWMEMRWGPDTRFSVDDLAAMEEAELIEQLCTDFDRREGLLDAWRQLVTAQPQRGLNVLETLAAAIEPGPADIWEFALMGLRDAENAGLITDQMMALLAKVPDVLFAKSDVVRAAADLLEARSRALREGDEPPSFWQLFDRALVTASDEPLDEGNEEADRQRDWVSEAINHSLGRIATAFINALFARRPRVGEALPEDLTQRADRLMSPDEPTHRLARVIGASRVSYLYAIDPEWTERTLIPSFSWHDEEESIAVWQAYAWQARIDPQLWAALKPSFLPLFRPDRLKRLGTWGRNIAQLLMLVGVDFDAEELRRDTVRDAIRAMPEEMRENAAAWIAGYMEAGEEDNSDEDEEPIEGSSDARWTQRIWPWLKRVWPGEVSLRSAGVAEQFALAVIATDRAFPEAVKAIQALATKTTGDRVLHQLNASHHPDSHPEATLELLDAFVARDRVVLFENDLVRIVERIGAANADIRGDNRYRQWAEFVAQRQL